MNRAGNIIVCHSCGARLKAGKGLIGKIVPCPKCQAKINVSENLSNHRNAPEDSLLEKTTVVGSHFEDIDSLLQSQNNSDSNSIPVSPETGVSGTGRTRTGRTRAGHNTMTGPQQRSGNAGTADSPSKESKETKETRGLKKRQAAPQPAENQAAPDDDLRSDHRFRGSVPVSSKPSQTTSQTTRGQGTTSAHRPPHTGTPKLGDAPLLPDDNWNHPAALKRSKLIKIITLIIATLLLIGVGFTLWMQPAKPRTPSDQMAQDDSNGSQPAAEIGNQLNPDIQADDDNQADLGNRIDLGEDAYREREPAQGDAGQAQRDERLKLTDNPLDLTTDVDGLPPLTTADSADSIDPLLDQPPPDLPPFPKTDRDQVNSPMPTNRAEQRQSDGANESNGVDGVDGVDGERLAGLAELLDEGQLAISRFQYLIPEPREQRRIGPPQFIVNRSEITRPDPQRQFDAICPKLSYQQTPLSIIVDDLMTITGIPMTFDLGAVKAMTGLSNPLVSIDLDGPTLGDAIDTMLESISLSKVVNENQGVLITALHADQLSLAKIGLPKFAFADPAEIDLARQELVLGIQNMFAPQSWQAGGNLGRIWIEQDELLVNNSPLVHFQIQDLVNRIDAGLVLKKTPSDLQAHQILQTRLSQLQPRLSAATEMQHTIARPLLHYLQQIRQQTGVTVFCDWESLASKGWHAQTSIPGNLYGSDLATALRLLTETLDITYVAVDQNTLWLTTYEAAESLNYLEFYSLGTLTQEKLTHAQILEIINEVLGADFRQPGVQVIFEPKYDSLILIAPQYLHRRTETLLREMERL